MVTVAVAGLALTVVFIVAETREDGIIDGAYARIAAITVALTVVAETVLALRPQPHNPLTTVRVVSLPAHCQQEH
jgi:hypothetical protein